MQHDKTAVAVSDPQPTTDRGMLVLQYAIGGFAAVAAVLLALVR